MRLGILSKNKKYHSLNWYVIHAYLYKSNVTGTGKTKANLNSSNCIELGAEFIMVVKYM